jgi:UTP--glucose-1-phosphate uridylyltransferase
MKIRKAVFPVAGLGTRVLPATKAMPKEMLTIVDKPLIQYVVDEAKEAGIEHFVFVTGRNKGVIEDHFDRMFELDTTLSARGKKAEQEILARDQPEAGAMSFTRQQAPHGLGHAVWCARDIVGNEPFAVVLPDELVLNTPGCLAQMIAAAGKLPEKSNLIAVEEVPEHLTHQYGICGVGKRHHQHTSMFEVASMVEKPPKGTAPSNFSITGRYILQPEIFKILETQERGSGGEIQLTDAMIGLNRTQNFYAVEFEGERHDCGSKAGFLRANIAYGMARADLREGLRADMKKYLKKGG